MRLTDAANYEVIQNVQGQKRQPQHCPEQKRQGKVNIKEAWCAIEEGQLYIKGMHISPYDHGNIFNVNPLRVRRLLLHRKEIAHLYSCVKQAGYSIVPLSLYFKGSLVKVQIGLCKGKKLYDKREDAAKRDAKRAIDRALKQKNQ